MAQLVLVRHAQASFGAKDYDNLSELGHTQSHLLGDYFAQREQTFDCLITGDMKRHKQTADGVLKSVSVAQTRVDASWNEFDFDNIVRTYLSIYPQQKPTDDSPRSEWYKVLRNAMVMWSKNELTNYAGETWSDFTGRVKKGMDTILASEHQNVIVVTSGGAMGIFLMLMLESTVQQAIAFNLQIKNTSVNHFFFNKKGFQLNSFNNVPHLDVPEHLHKITYS